VPGLAGFILGDANSGRFRQGKDARRDGGIVYRRRLTECVGHRHQPLMRGDMGEHRPVCGDVSDGVDARDSRAQARIHGDAAPGGMQPDGLQPEVLYVRAPADR